MNRIVTLTRTMWLAVRIRVGEPRTKGQAADGTPPSLDDAPGCTAALATTPGHRAVELQLPLGWITFRAIGSVAACITATNMGL